MVMPTITMLMPTIHVNADQLRKKISRRDDDDDDRWWNCVPILTVVSYYKVFVEYYITNHVKSFSEERFEFVRQEYVLSPKHFHSSL